MLYLYRRVIFGVLEKENLQSITDLNKREILIFMPLVLVVLIMGIYPNMFLDVMHASVENLVNRYQSALASANYVFIIER